MARLTRSVSLVCPPSPGKIPKGETRVALRRFWDHAMSSQSDQGATRPPVWYNPVRNSLIDHAVEWP